MNGRWGDWSKGSGPEGPLHDLRFSVCGCEEVLVDVTRDLAAEVGGLDVGRPEVDPSPDARFEHLVRQVGEAGEGPLLGREPAAGRLERHLVGTEERGKRGHAGTGVGGGARRVVRVRRRA